MEVQSHHYKGWVLPVLNETGLANHFMESWLADHVNARTRGREFLEMCGRCGRASNDVVRRGGNGHAIESRHDIARPRREVGHESVTDSQLFKSRDEI